MQHLSSVVRPISLTPAISHTCDELAAPESTFTSAARSSVVTPTIFSGSTTTWAPCADRFWNLARVEAKQIGRLVLIGSTRIPAFAIARDHRHAH